MKLTKRHAQFAIAVAAIAITLQLMISPQNIPSGFARWWTILGSAGAGYAFGWLVSPRGKHVRRIVGVGLLGIVLVAVFIANGYAGLALTSLVSLVAFFLALGFWLGSVSQSFFARPTTFGSAEWATFDYLQANGMVGDKGIRLGVFPGKDGMQPLHYTGDRHLLTIAPTRSGKGTTAIIPNLLTYEGSALVIDPKGENAMITAARRAAMGQAIHVVDPWMIAASAGFTSSRFNPLDWLVLGDPDITENAMLLADALIVPDGGGDRFWIEEAKALLQGLILYVATDPREAATRHLGRVRDLLLLDGEDMPRLFQRMVESVHHVVSSTGARCLQKEEKLLANVVASAQAQTHFLDSIRIRENLSASDFSFEDLKSGKVTIYLCLPADRLHAFGRWLRLLIQQAITVNARNIELRPDRPVLFLLDEMPALGRLSMVEEAYGLMAGFGMQLWGIVQDAGQLKRIYGDSWEGFVANSGVITYLGSRDRMTADYFSALCGVTTVWNLSSAISRTFGNNSSSTSTNDTTSASQRQLAYADELMRLHRNCQLTLIENHHPIMGNKVRWFDDPALKAMGRNLHAERAGQ